MITLPLPPRWRDRVLVIVGGEPDDEWFTPEELRVANDFRLEKRRREWKLSRMAAKKLAMERGLASSPFDVIVSRPSVLQFHVSLSHSERYAGAAVDMRPIGLDVQAVRDLSDAAAHLFLTDEEIAVEQSCRTVDRLLHFWTAKEAAWKQLGGSIDTLKRVPLKLEEANEHSMRFDRVETERVGDVIVAVTRPTF